MMFRDIYTYSKIMYIIIYYTYIIYKILGYVRLCLLCPSGDDN